MPVEMHSFYLRTMYQENRLAKPGGISLAGVPIDLRRITSPAFIVSAREDHIAPWRSTYVATGLYRGPIKFVLAESGHIAGIISPPGSSGSTSAGEIVGPNLKGAIKNLTHRAEAYAFVLAIALSVLQCVLGKLPLLPRRENFCWTQFLTMASARRAGCRGRRRRPLRGTCRPAARRPDPTLAAGSSWRRAQRSAAGKRHTKRHADFLVSRSRTRR
jgi:hypothetical protein